MKIGRELKGIPEEEEKTTGSPEETEGLEDHTDPSEDLFEEE